VEGCLYSLGWDATEAIKQAEELKGLLASTFPEGVPNDVSENLLRLLTDFDLGNADTTLRAENGGVLVISLKFGNIYGDIVAALRAGKISRFLHDCMPSIASPSAF
jgi:hypothetical protein